MSAFNTFSSYCEILSVSSPNKAERARRVPRREAGQPENKQSEKEENHEQKRYRFDCVVHKLDYQDWADRSPYDYLLGVSQGGSNGLRQGVSDCPDPQAAGA